MLFDLPYRCQRLFHRRLTAYRHTGSRTTLVDPVLCRSARGFPHDRPEDHPTFALEDSHAGYRARTRAQLIHHLADNVYFHQPASRIV